ncbi:hypothetical protein SORBI_3010G257000 [Sorghum bicolor]|uniref:Response regulatory domain-containing protein n=1 Tax=Sorghum bicolor TaxID=4558 RepID=A0A194YLI8_SORBI|nr:hypothetical protein SORBI_3010G257000 [Sorghum bicolor]
MMERLSALVLDSDPTSLSTISETLAKFNFKVFPFQTAEAALDFIEGGAAKEAELDLVLVDVNLNNMAPGTSANSDLLHHYVLNELEVPLTAMCSCDDQEALSKCMNLGACFHVLKPLDRRSFGVLWHQALEHKSKKAAVQGPTLNSTRNGMVSSSSTAKPKEVLILERNDLSDPEINGHEEPKKRNRITWTIELHEKFLEAVETLGGNECYGAFTEISGSSNMITSNQVGENNRTEFARDNDHMENINLLKVYGAFIENAGSSSLLTSDQVEQNNLTEDARNNDAMGKNNFFKGTVDPKYNASMDFSVAWAHLESNDLDLTGPSDGREEAYSFRMSQLESLGLEVLHDNACNDALRSVDLINIDEPVTQGSQEQQSLGMEDLQQVDDIPWDDALISVGLINLLDEPMTEEAAVGGSQDQESLALEVLQAGNNAWDDDLRSARMVNLLDEPVAQEATIGDALMDDPVSPIAQDDVLWAWSPSMPAVDYGMLF